MEQRLINEIKHGKYLVAHGAGEIWNWETPAGRVRWARRTKMLTSRLTPEMKVLELGCGTGYFTRELVKSNATITAIDISPDLLELAEQEIDNSNVTFRIDNAYQLSFPDGHFDAVIGSSVLHHLDVQKAVSEIFRVLKPNGFMVFTEPNMMNPQIALQKNIPYLKRKLGDSPDETAFFCWPLSRLLRKQGFSGIKIEPFDFLHPAIPPKMISLVSWLGMVMENLPLIREIAGSLYIVAKKPK